MPSKDAKSPDVGKAADMQDPLYLVEEVLKIDRRMQVLRMKPPRSKRSKQYEAFVEKNEELQKLYNKFFDHAMYHLKVHPKGIDWFIITLCEYGKEVKDDLSNSKELATQFCQAAEIERTTWPAPPKRSPRKCMVCKECNDRSMKNGFVGHGSCD